MTNILFYGDTIRSPAMRHELPIAIVDPFLLGVVDGRMHVAVSHLESDRVAEVAPDAVLHDFTDLGLSELLESGLSFDGIDLELTARAAAAMGITEALVDPEMPVAVADRLRADGIVLTPDAEAIAVRRRVKSAAELQGMRRAQVAAEAGMAAAAAVLAGAELDGDRLRYQGEVLIAETVRAALRDACHRAGAPTPPDIIVTSVWQGTGHVTGAGPLPANLPIVIDLWPRDEQSTCWADMTRTFVVGEISEAVRAQETLVRQALERAREAIRPGVTGREIHNLACDIFEAAGRRTRRTGQGEDPSEGFQFSLGHGVGLGIHEAPAVGLTGREPLMAGDVVAIEPGLWDGSFGEVRLEDLLLVTETGCETLTRFPYDLTP